jgi:hypothetical protein
MTPINAKKCNFYFTNVHNALFFIAQVLSGKGRRCGSVGKGEKMNETNKEIPGSIPTLAGMRQSGYGSCRKVINESKLEISVMTVKNDINSYHLLFMNGKQRDFLKQSHPVNLISHPFLSCLILLICSRIAISLMPAAQVKSSSQNSTPDTKPASIV